MSELQSLDASAAAGCLRAAPGGTRGFLGLDPVTQNDALLRKEIDAQGAQLYRSGETILGYLPNTEQPRQGVVASTSGDPSALRALLVFLRSYQRCTSYVGYLPFGAPAEAAFRACGFEQVGTLSGHLFQNGDYLDVGVYFANGDSTCPS